MIEKVTLEMTRESDFRLAEGRKCQDLNPKAMMLYAAARCAGLTAMHIMQKEHVKPARFEISVSGEISTDTVQAETVFHSFHVVYNVECGRTEDQTKVSRALTLTQEKHCGMMQMLRKVAPVTHEIAIVSTQPAEV